MHRAIKAEHLNSSLCFILRTVLMSAMHTIDIDTQYHINVETENIVQKSTSYNSILGAIIIAQLNRTFVLFYFISLFVELFDGNTRTFVNQTKDKKKFSIYGKDIYCIKVDNHQILRDVGSNMSKHNHNANTKNSL